MNKKDINQVLICDGCGSIIDPDNDEVIIDHDGQNVCQKCYDYLQSDEYRYDLKDKEGESRYEQHAEK